jgi:hypothetical protein
MYHAIMLVMWDTSTLKDIAFWRFDHGGVVVYYDACILNLERTLSWGRPVERVDPISRYFGQPMPSDSNLLHGR